MKKGKSVAPRPAPSRLERTAWLMVIIANAVQSAAILVSLTR